MKEARETNRGKRKTQVNQAKKTSRGKENVMNRGRQANEKIASATAEKWPENKLSKRG